MDKNAEKALESAVEELTRRFGKGSVMYKDESVQNIDIIPTGSLKLDIALGVGGVPRGRILEIYGPESSGKTTFCYELIAQAQKLGGACAFVDTEHALDRAYAERLGVDFDHLVMSQPDYGEQALEIAEAMVRSGAISVVVVDSVAALTPKAELEGEMGDSHMGLQARMMSQAMRKLVGAVAQNNTLLIFTNQLRMKIGVMFGSPETTAGGNALKFYSSIRLDIRRIETLKEGTEAVANRVRVKVIKNKVASPFKQAEFTIGYGTGYDRLDEIIELGQEKDVGLITKSGSFLTFEETGEKAQGKNKGKLYLAEHPEVALAIERKVREVKLGGRGIETMPTVEELKAQIAAAAEASAEEETAETSPFE